MKGESHLMKRRVIVRIVLGLVLLLALYLFATNIVLPLFDTSDELKSYVPVINRYSGVGDALNMENDYLSLTMDPETSETLNDLNTLFAIVCALAVLQEVSKLDTEGELAKLILAMYEKILAGATLYDLRCAADAVKASTLKPIV